MELLVGEYDNHEQVWQQELDGESVDDRQHWRFRRDGENSLQLSVGNGQAAPDTPAWTLTFSEDAHGIVAEFRGAGLCVTDGAQLAAATRAVRTADVRACPSPSESTASS